MVAAAAATVSYTRPPPPGKRAGRTVDGELWSVHGGHFYQVVKFKVAPERLPTTLHWFKYEAYFTWISGFALLGVVYYLEPTAFMVDRSVMVLNPWVAVAIGVGTLFGGWVVYHLLCKSPLGHRPLPFAVLGFALMTLVAYGLTQVLGSRAAYIHVGALIGTLMAWNVFFVIIPNQKVAVAAMTRGEEPAPGLGEAASQRSLPSSTMPVAGPPCSPSPVRSMSRRQL